MIDYFSYNGKGFLPRYSPGIPGYGQKGAPGNTGETGASIYYSSFILSNESERLAAQEKLNSGKSLSNNILYNDSDVIEYSDGDIVLDAEGNFYEIEESNGSLQFKVDEDSQVNINTNASLSVRDFIVSCITSFKVKKTGVDPDLMNEPEPDPDTGEVDYPDYDDNTYSWKIDNPYYINLTTHEDTEATYSKSPYIAHKNYYSKYLYGNHIKFTIVNKEPLENCMFKYCLVFPSGETISLTTDSMTGIIFVDNSFIYDNIGGDEPFSEYTYKIDEDSSPETIKNLIEDLGEDNRHISIAASEYIKEYCKAYVEITNMINNTTYRIDVDDLFFRGSELVEISEDDEYSADSRVDHVIPGKLNTEWKFVDYISEEEYHPEKTTNDYVRYVINTGDARTASQAETHSRPTFLKSFNQFNKYSFERVDCNYSKDSYIIEAKYKFGGYVSEQQYAYNDIDDPSSQDILTNSTIRLYFNKLKTFTLIIKYNPINKAAVEQDPSITPIYPSANVYIGIPNIPLPKWKADATTAEGWTIENAATPGIVYLNKIVPIANPNESSIYTKEVDAGIAQVIINTDNYPTIENKNNTNFVEIGIISTEDNEGSTIKHCSDYDISLYIFSMDDAPEDIVIDDAEEEEEPIIVDNGDFIPAQIFS